MHRKILLAFCLLQASVLFAQTETRKTILEAAAKIHRQHEEANRQKALALAAQKGWPTSFKSGINTALLVGVDDAGYPLYVTTESNVVAATTTGANQLWNGGISGLNLSGSSASLTDKMGIWEVGGVPLTTHVELTGRILQRDGSTSTSEHATHVAGTMIASGVNPAAKGMAYGLQRLVSYDQVSDVSEMMNEGPALLLSNHSYGTISGWYYNNTQSRWEFRGRANENEDYKFGYYDNQAQLFDSIAYNAPNYLIVKSAGNNRNVNGPAVGATYYRYDASGAMTFAGQRSSDISSNNGYDIIATYGTAKNILTIGAVNGLANGYSKKEDVVISSFSSWGPTDDGRIKPDVVADGVNLFSSTDASNTSYSTFSGTSMASPNATGSLLLLQEYYNRLHPGTFMRSATLKGLTIHTANEAGNAPGPDYIFGWGLVNVAKAAEVIKANNTGSHRIFENTLTNGQPFTTIVVASGQGPLTATICWTDPKASVVSSGLAAALNNRTPKLINDLDIRITKGSTVSLPWVLDPAIPSADATRGDNILDNVERINIENAVPGETYTVTITHKGTLERSSQAYSLIMSGVGGQAYCTSAASSSTGTRIDSVSFGTIQNANPAGCTTYKNFTNLATTIEPGQTLPLRVRVSSCDATVTNKIVKVFIDLNSNGSFADAGELLATSSVINGNGVFTTNVAIPSVVAGNSSVMRVVAQETATAADINPCGTYSNGETQDYRINFGMPSNDLSIVAIEAPSASACASPNQFVTVRIRNNGGVAKASFPIKVTVQSGTTVVATLSGTYPATLNPGEQVSYTFQTPFAANGGTTYNYIALVNEAADQNRSNDTLRANITTAATLPAPSAQASICGTTANLRVTNPSISVNYFWYSSATSETPIASGTPSTTTVLPTNNQYFVGSGATGTVGLANNTAFSGGYLTSNASNYMTYSATVPVVLENARLYTKWPGKIDLIVADITLQSGGYTYTTLASTTLDVYATSPNPAPGAQAVYDPQDAGAIFNINLSLPAGNHAIIVRPQGDANIFRNNNITGDPYPFTLPGIISLTGNSVQSPNNPQSFYYYLYNMRIRTADCPSPRTTVTATVAPTPAISMVGDSLESSIASGNQWNRDGSPIAGSTGRRYKPLTDGNYTVTVTDATACQRTSAVYNVTGTAINPVLNAEVGLKLGPNPNQGEFTVSFKMTTRENLTIELVNAQGQAVLTKQYPSFTGAFNETFRRNDLPSGLYLLRVRHGKKVYHEKVSIQR